MERRRPRGPCAGTIDQRTIDPVHCVSKFILTARPRHLPRCAPLLIPYYIHLALCCMSRGRRRVRGAGCAGCGATRVTPGRARARSTRSTRGRGTRGRRGRRGARTPRTRTRSTARAPTRERERTAPGTRGPLSALASAAARDPSGIRSTRAPRCAAASGTCDKQIAYIHILPLSAKILS